MAEFKIFIAMNEKCEVGLGVTEEDALDYLDDVYQGNIRRVVKLNIDMSPPEIEDTGLTVEIPDTSGKTVKVEVE